MCWCWALRKMAPCFMRRGPGLRGAARELRHILAEGLRTQFQPLDHGKVGEPFRGQIIHPHEMVDREGRALDQRSDECQLGNGCFSQSRDKGPPDNSKKKNRKKDD